MTTLQISRQSTCAPARGRKRVSMNQLSGWKTACAVFLLCAATAIGAPAQTFTTLASFYGWNGANPQFSLAQGTDGNFYGTTSAGSTFGLGTVFEITPGGAGATLHSFDGTDGEYPLAGLTQATDGNFYGTTYGRERNNDWGTVFKITPGGALTTLHSFEFDDGAEPEAGLVQAADGNFYGITYFGGLGDGTVFKITSSGTLTTLYNFCPLGTNCSSGAPPAGLVQATDGNFYGTTVSGGTNNVGTVFKITPAGQFTVLHTFDNTDGSNPLAGPVQATDGNFYGTTSSGGANGDGTVFKITPAGNLTTLYSFCSQTNCTDGANPYAGLVQATDGNFYGTTNKGGTNNDGTVFEITPAGKLTTLHSFDGTDGANPYGLVQATNGTFYGTTIYGGGAYNDGTVFSLSVGLGPFVETLPTSGKVDATVIILGNNLTGSTAVSFNGTPVASFRVNSTGSAIQTTVPAGATTGPVTVATPSDTLSSNISFRVMPQILSFSPTSGPVGTSVVITGNSFTGATLVGFGGVPTTSFTVNSDTQITATVPAGAQTGLIAVHTAGGNAQSAASFTVTP
jgi:uncharacterized repeat protein (TIGR03803 family)